MSKRQLYRHWVLANALVEMVGLGATLYIALFKIRSRFLREENGLPDGETVW